MNRMLLLIMSTTFTVGCGGSQTPPSENGDPPQSASPEADPKAAPSRPSGPGKKSVALPQNLPEDVPVYPSAKSVYVGTSQGGIRQSPTTSIRLETADSVEKVHAFYEQKMSELGWTVGVKSPPIVNGKKDKRNLNVTIVEMPRNPGTVSITIVYN